MYTTLQEPTDSIMLCSQTNHGHAMKSSVEKQSRLFFMSKCHAIFELRMKTTSFSFEVIETIIKSGKATRLFSLNLGLDHKRSIL